jgi:hypothetical protein
MRSLMLAAADWGVAVADGNIRDNSCYYFKLYLFNTWNYEFLLNSSEFVTICIASLQQSSL